VFLLEPGFNLWVAIGFVYMERRFAVEAKSFSFSPIAGKTKLHLEEMRKGFVGSLFLSLQCSNWLADMVEAVSLSPREEDSAKSFSKNRKALKVHKGWNKSGRFLVAAVFAQGGRRGGIWFPKGHEGWGWRRIVGELRKCLGFLTAEERPLVSSVNSGGVFFIQECSYVAVLSLSTGGLKLQSDFHLNLCPVASWHKLAKGNEVVRSPVNCFELETVAPLKKINTRMGSGGHSGLRGGSDCSGLSGSGLSQLKVFRVSRAWKFMLEKIRLDVDQVSRLALRPIVPLGFRLRARRQSYFSGPRLGSKPKFLGAALEPCSGLSSGVGSFLGQIVP
jgi:hypothetical protein